MSVDLRVYAELNDFVKPDEQYMVLRRPFRPHQTVKDVVEAAGIPHTEVDLVLVNGESVDFDHRPRHGDRITAYPVFETLDIARVTRVRPGPLREPFRRGREPRWPGEAHAADGPRRALPVG